MANPNFDPQASSNTLWFGDQEDVCLTDVVDGKAEADHTHTGYAAAAHEHTEYADADHTHDGYAAANHEHDGYADADHTHAQSDISGLDAALEAKADLVDGKVPTAQLPGYVDDVVEYSGISNFPATGESGKIYVAADTNKTYRWSGTGYVEISASLALGETAATAYRGDRGKIAYDHSQNGDVHVTPAQKTAWDNKADGDHTHTPAGIGAAPASHTHDYAAADHSHMEFPSDTTLASYKLVYIATNGDDSKDGFTQANAMATIKGVIKKYAEKYKALDIRLLDGTYTENTWSISVDQCNLSIRSASENKDAVTINLTGNIETNVNKLRLYNMTINVTETNVRAVSVTAGELYAYGMRFNVPAASDASCVNVYNGSSAFLMNCVLNSGTGTSAGAAVYGNQAMLIKVINCTSERTVRLGFHAHNGSDIVYTDTITATTKTKQTSWGKCTLRT